MNNDFLVTRDAICQWRNIWQIASLVTKKSLFMVIHALFYISCIVNTMVADDLAIFYQIPRLCGQFSPKYSQ